MTTHAAGRAAPVIRLAVLGLLLAIIGGVLGAPAVGQAQNVIDYDTDDDRLIEIASLAQLNAIRWDLDGNGTVSQANAANYLLAFPDRDTGSTTPMGCPPVQTGNPCLGYELTADLDFDEDGDGSTHTDGAGDSGDETYYNGGAGWAPTGQYTAIFEGNGHTISNLYINSTAGGFVGLFGDMSGATVRNLGLINPYVRNTGGGTWVRTGALAGRMQGSSAGSGLYVSGGTVDAPSGGGSRFTGCVVGFIFGATLSGSWASCAASAATGTPHAGGLVGGTQNDGSVWTVVSDSYATGTVSGSDAGGLIGEAQASFVRRSYATGTVSGSNAGGLVGDAGGVRIEYSYATGAVSGWGNIGGLVGHLNVDATSIIGSYATGAVTGNGRVGGLVGLSSDGTIIRASYATGNVAVTGSSQGGGLVGRLAGPNTHLSASYATGNVTASGVADSNLGGLVGSIARLVYINASYAAGNVSSSSSGNDCLGGLAGYIHLGADSSPTEGQRRTIDGYPQIRASYTISRLTVSGGGADVRGGLFCSTNALRPSGAILDQSYFVDNNTYWLNTSGATNGARRGGSPRSAAALQAPTGYAGIYGSWRRNVGAGCDNEPWDFGNGSQYPILVCQPASGIAEQLIRWRGATAMDYDDDDDRLIDVRSLAQLNAIRHDLTGFGHTAPVNGSAYETAFPGLTAGMGCPDGGCRGYELRAGLDFASDSDYADWTPIGTAASPYTGVFDGKGHPMSNLSIASATGHVGLFGVVRGPNALLAGASLPDVDIDLAAAPIDVGALAGFVGGGGAVRTSYASGTIAAPASGDDEIHAGGLVGRAGALSRIAASYSQVGITVTSDAPATATDASSGVGGLVGELSGAAASLTDLTATYAAGAVSSNWESATPPLGGLVGLTSGVTRTRASYWDAGASGIADDADDNPPEGKTTAELQGPTRYAGIYETWNDYDLDGDGETDTPWDFGRATQYPKLDVLEHVVGECPPDCPTTEPEEYVAPPIVYNLNIRFNVKGLTLDEGESATYRVRMSRPPVGRPARVAITSNNPDVVVAPTEVTFSSADYNEWQTVKVSTLRDPNDTDESATLAHRGPNLSYGSILVAVNDTWPGAAVETVNGHTVTMRHTLDAPYGVTVTAPDTLDADMDITIAGPPAGTPEGAPGYGLGESDAARMLADIRVQGTPADGLDICLPVSEALVTEAGERPLTLLRYADGGWAPVAGAERRDSGDGVSTELLCAAGVMEFGVFAAAYMLPELGAVSDLVAVAGDAPGTVTLTWTPGANAAMHWVAGVKRSDLSDFAVWAAADDMGSHTVSGLDGGETYVFTVTAGRGEGDGSEWSAWAAWVTATATASAADPAPAANAADAAGP